jgi:ribosomal protein S6 kinase alpha-5
VGGPDDGKLYAMKVIKKATIMQSKTLCKFAMSERRVLERVGDANFLVKLYYAFETETDLYLVMGKYIELLYAF